MFANGYKVSLGSDKSILKLDCDDGCTTSNMPTSHQMIRFVWVNFYICEH